MGFGGMGIGFLCTWGWLKVKRALATRVLVFSPICQGGILVPPFEPLPLGSHLLKL